MRLNISNAIATIILVLSAMPAAQAYDFTVGGVYYNYTYDKKGAIVTYRDLQNNTYTGDVNIPAQVSYGMNTMTVKGIGDHAFFNCQTITSVTLHEGITYIEDQAFSHCYAMKSITLPQSLTRISDYAFEYCEDMTSFTIPKGVTQIGNSVFYDCLSISAYEVEEGNTQYTSVDGVLYLSDKSVLVQYPAAKTDPEYTIAEEVKSIPDVAFSPAPYLEKVNIGANVGRIEPLTFSECAAMCEFEVSPDNAALCSIDGVLFDKEAKRLLQYPVANSATEYTLPNTVESIADGAMMGSRHITTLTLPESLSTIGEVAFSGCSGIKRVISQNPTPPSVSTFLSSGAAFDDIVYATATLYVNESAIEAYRNHAVWGKFANIADINSAGIEEIPGDAKAPAVTVSGLTVIAANGEGITAYDLAGRIVGQGTGRMELPSAGIYLIVTSSGSTVKVAAK